MHAKVSYSKSEPIGYSICNFGASLGPHGGSLQPNPTTSAILYFRPSPYPCISLLICSGSPQRGNFTRECKMLNLLWCLTMPCKTPHPLATRASQGSESNMGVSPPHCFYWLAPAASKREGSTYLAWSCTVKDAAFPTPLAMPPLSLSHKQKLPNMNMCLIAHRSRPLKHSLLTMSPFKVIIGFTTLIFIKQCTASRKNVPSQFDCSIAGFASKNFKQSKMRPCQKSKHEYMSETH